MKENLITALYERLSRDDDLDGESNSIVNQKLYLQNYADEHGFTNCKHYTDDGWSGGNFDRPGWKSLIADVEAGKVGVILAKDMSRIGRNYLETGFYTEVVFRKHNVRFIAIANGVDNDHPETGEFVPFLNIMNEWYLKDQSKKVTAAYQLRGKSGLPTNNNCLYGYRKDPDIAIDSHVDNSRSDSLEFAPMLNVLNEMYLHDLSKKVNIGFRAKGMSGQSLTSTPLFGYKRDPEDKKGTQNPRYRRAVWRDSNHSRIEADSAGIREHPLHFLAI